ncbi:MAG: hypothetical protein ACEQSH_00025 [Bacteroidia bacterium]
MPVLAPASANLNADGSIRLAMADGRIVTLTEPEAQLVAGLVRPQPVHPADALLGRRHGAVDAHLTHFRDIVASRRDAANTEA